MSQAFSPGPYRVRIAWRNELTVPDQVAGPRFTSRHDAETYAQGLVGDQHRRVVVEKLAPSGCWLQLATLG